MFEFVDVLKLIVLVYILVLYWIDASYLTFFSNTLVKVLWVLTIIGVFLFVDVVLGIVLAIAFILSIVKEEPTLLTGQSVQHFDDGTGQVPQIGAHEVEEARARAQALIQAQAPPQAPPQAHQQALPQLPLQAPPQLPPHLFRLLWDIIG